FLQAPPSPAAPSLSLHDALPILALALAAAPPVAHRGLTATAETVAVVGLLVVSIAGYALWTTGVVGALPGPVYSGLVAAGTAARSEEHTSELQSRENLVCRLLLE